MSYPLSSPMPNALANILSLLAQRKQNGNRPPNTASDVQGNAIAQMMGGLDQGQDSPPSMPAQMPLSAIRPGLGGDTPPGGTIAGVQGVQGTSPVPPPQTAADLGINTVANGPLERPERSDYFGGIGNYRDAPTYVQPVRDTRGEARKNIAGISLAALGTILGGGAKYLPSALSGYMNGAKEAQDTAYNNQVAQSEGNYNSGLQATNAYNQNLARQTQQDQNAFNDAQQDYRLQIGEQDKANALKAGATKQNAADRTTFLGRFTGATTGGKTTSAQRAALIQLTPPAELARMGFQPDGSDLTAAAKPIDDELDAQETKKAGVAAQKTRTTALTQEAASLSRDLLNPYTPQESKPAILARLQQIKQYTGIGAGGVAPIGMATTQAQNNSNANAQANIALRGQSVGIAQKNLDLANQRFGLAEKQFGALQKNRNNVDLRTFSDLVNKANDSVEGKNGLVNTMRNAQGQIQSLNQLITSGVDTDGTQLTHIKKQLYQTQVNKLMDNVDQYQKQITAKRAQVQQYQQWLQGAMPPAKPSQPVALSPGVEQYRPTVAKYAQQYGVPLNLAMAVMDNESSGRQTNPDGSLYTSGSGAQGIMQLMPGTAKELGVDPTNVNDNINGGVKMLGQLLKRYGGNQQLALAAYNAGAGAVDRAGKQIPNYPETQEYVRRAMSKMAGTSGGNGVGATMRQPQPSGQSQTASVDTSKMSNDQFKAYYAKRIAQKFGGAK